MMPASANSPSIEAVLQEVERGLQSHLYYLAVVMALTIPDICAALEAPNGQTSGLQYKAWYNTYLAPHYPSLTDADIWSLRCGVVHQGRFGHPRMQYSRVVFTLPDGRGNVYHRCVLNDALNLDASLFCRDMVHAARQWYATKRSDQHVQANLPNLVQYRPQGISPYIFGVPLIA